MNTATRTTVCITAATMRNAEKAARTVFGYPTRTKPETISTGGGHMYRLTYPDGNAAEVTLRARACTEVHAIIPTNGGSE